MSAAHDTVVDDLELGDLLLADDRCRWLTDEEYVDWCLAEEEARSRRLADQVSAEGEDE